MSYLPEGAPLPNVEEIDTRDWWQACRRHELVVQRCSSCGTFRHPPEPICYSCHSFEYYWHNVSGVGKVYTYTIAHHPSHAALRGHPPYNVVAVELPDAEGVRMIGNVLDVPNEEIYVGMDVVVTWEERGGITFPQWKAAPR